MSNILDLTLVDLVEKVKKKDLSSKEITKVYVERSEKSKKLNTYITEDFKNALKKSDNFDSNPDFNKKLPGIPIAVKDISYNIAKLINLPICLWDERLSTVGAFNISSQLDVNVTKREKDIDKNAAAFILQGAIDYLNN